jgi:hypothetical protein
LEDLLKGLEGDAGNDSNADNAALSDDNSSEFSEDAAKDGMATSTSGETLSADMGTTTTADSDIDETEDRRGPGEATIDRLASSRPARFGRLGCDEMTSDGESGEADAAMPFVSDEAGLRAQESMSHDVHSEAKAIKHGVFDQCGAAGATTVVGNVNGGGSQRPSMAGSDGRHAAAKYVPPAMRKQQLRQERATLRMAHDGQGDLRTKQDASMGQTPELERVRRQICSLINRVASINLAKVAQQLSDMFMQVPRHAIIDVIVTTTMQVCPAFVSPSSNCFPCFLCRGCAPRALHACTSAVHCSGASLPLEVTGCWAWA